MPPSDTSGSGGPGPSKVFTSAPGITFSLDPRGIVRTILEGPIQVEQLAAHALARDEAGLLAAPQILDARAAELKLSVDDVKRIALLAGERRQRGAVGPSAMVTTDDFAYGMARMFAAYDPDNTGFAVFRTIEEAERWLST